MPLPSFAQDLLIDGSSLLSLESRGAVRVPNLFPIIPSTALEPPPHPRLRRSPGPLAQHPPASLLPCFPLSVPSVPYLLALSSLPSTAPYPSPRSPTLSNIPSPARCADPSAWVSRVSCPRHTRRTVPSCAAPQPPGPPRHYLGLGDEVRGPLNHSEVALADGAVDLVVADASRHRTTGGRGWGTRRASRRGHSSGGGRGPRGGRWQ